MAYASRVQRILSQQAISLLSQWNSDTETDDDESNDNNYSQDNIQSSSASDLSNDSDNNSVLVMLLGTVGLSITQQHGRAGRPQGPGGPRGNSRRKI